MIDGSDHTVETTKQFDRERRGRNVRVNGATAHILRVPKQLVAKVSLMLGVLSLRIGEALQASAHAEPQMKLQPVRIKADFRK